MKNSFKIIPYNKNIGHWFKTINSQWLIKYFEMEDQDVYELENPLKSIIDKGGYIYFAEYQNKIVGCFSLKKINNTTFELAKMGVLDEFQDKKIGSFLVSNAINIAQKLKIERLILYSNTILIKAIYLYKKIGFIEIENDNKNLKRANIKMVLNLNLVS